MRLLKRLGRELAAVWQMGGWNCFMAYVGQMLCNASAIIKNKSLAPADRGMVGKSCAFRIFGHNIALDGELFGLAREIYGRKVYFALPDFRLRSTDVVVDLGAHAGVFTVLAGRLAKKVIAVEAQSGFISELLINAENNKCSEKIYVEFGIIGASSGILSDVRNLVSASHYKDEPSPISMEDIIARHSLEVINFLKMDIEGSEFDLLSGDIEWLSCVKNIVMEVHTEFGDQNRIVEILRSKSFDVFLLDSDQNIRVVP